MQEGGACEILSNFQDGKEFNIKVVSRLCPPKRGEQGPFILHNVTEDNKLQIKYECDTYMKGPRFEFAFDKVFDINQSNQDEQIYDIIGEPLVEKVLSGYNASIIAYGPTKTGKTYTLNGGNSYDNRGLIPRAIATLFERKTEDMTIKMSYIEIKNNLAYDLISTVLGEQQRLPELLKVQVNFNIELKHDVVQAQGLHFAHLTSPIYEIEDNEEAFRLLYIGETNRTVSMSAPSECGTILTLYVTQPDPSKGILKTNKLIFIEMPSSDERKENSGVSGKMNQDIFQFHNVITALKNKKSLVPFRTSKLMTIFKETLGANCITVMVFTMALEHRNRNGLLEACKLMRSVKRITNKPKAIISQQNTYVVNVEQNNDKQEYQQNDEQEYQQNDEQEYQQQDEEQEYQQQDEEQNGQQYQHQDEEQNEQEYQREAEEQYQQEYHEEDEEQYQQQDEEYEKEETYESPGDQNW